MCVDSSAEGVQRERLAHDLGKGVVGYTAFPQIGEKCVPACGRFFTPIFSQRFSWSLSCEKCETERSAERQGTGTIATENLITTEELKQRITEDSMLCCVLPSPVGKGKVMAENYSIIRIEKHKLSDVTPICNHHERLKERYKSNPDIDTERSHLNFHIVEPPDKYRPLVLARINEAGAKMRKDSVVMQDCIVAATPEWIMAMSDEAQAEYFRYAYEFFEKRYRRENIISAVVHMDEKTPHMHLVFVPITEDNRLSSKDIIGGPKGMHQLQDDFYEHMEAKYPDLVRGKSKQITHREHIPTYLFKKTADLFTHYEEIVNAVNDIGLLNNDKKKAEAVALIGLYAPEMAQLKNEVRTTDRYIENQEKRIAELEQSVRSKSRVISGKDDELYEKQREITNLKLELKGKVHDLNKMQKKLLAVYEILPPEIREELEADKKQRRRNDRER